MLTVSLSLRVMLSEASAEWMALVSSLHSSGVTTALVIFSTPQALLAAAGDKREDRGHYLSCPCHQPLASRVSVKAPLGMKQLLSHIFLFLFSSYIKKNFGIFF